MQQYTLQSLNAFSCKLRHFSYFFKEGNFMLGRFVFFRKMKIYSWTSKIFSTVKQSCKFGFQFSSVWAYLKMMSQKNQLFLSTPLPLAMPFFITNILNTSHPCYRTKISDKVFPDKTSKKNDSVFNIVYITQ